VAISYVNGTSNTATNGADVTLTLSGLGLQQNDLVIIAYGIGDNDNVDFNMAMVSSGWTEIADLFANDTQDVSLGVYWKFMGATPDTSAVVDGQGGVDAATAAVALAFRGVDTTTPFDVASTTATGIDTGNADPPSIDHLNPSGLWTVIAAATGNTLNASTYTFPTGYTTNARQATGQDTSNVTVGMGYRSSGVSDPENPGVLTHSQTSTNNAWAAVTMALRPGNVDRRAKVTWGELEAPNASRRARVTWAELQTPVAPLALPVTDSFTGTDNDPWDYDKWEPDTSGGVIDINSNKGRLERGAGAGASVGGRAMIHAVTGNQHELTAGVFHVSGAHDVTISLRASGLFVGDVPDDGYSVVVRSGGNTSAALYKNISSVQTLITNFTVSNATSRRVRLYCNWNGSTNELKVREWADGSGEPGTWNVETTNNEVTINGRLFVAVWATGAGAVIADLDDVDFHSTVTSDRRARVTWGELEAGDAPRRARVTWAELETTDAPRRAKVTWGELEVGDAPRRGRVTWAELETGDAPRRARVTWAELEVNDAPRRARVTWAELEAPPADRFAKVTWAEFEVPTAPRRAVVSWAEAEAPSGPRRAVVTWVEFEVPDALRRAVISWAEMEAGDAPRRAQVTWGEMEVPTAPRRAVVTWGELQVPDAARRAQVSWAELEVPAVGRAVVSWAEFEVPTAPRGAVASWAEFEVPNVGYFAKVTWAELEVPDGQRRARVTWAELETGDAARRVMISWSEMEVGDPPAGPRAARVTWVELEAPDDPRPPGWILQQGVGI
jgi:hypothetical protein